MSVEQLQAFLRAAGGSPPADGAGGATFVVETRDRPSAEALERRVRQAGGEAAIRVAPVFQSDDPDLARFFRVEFAAGRLPSGLAETFDLEYALADALDAASVQALRPDADVMPPPEPEPTPEAAISSGSGGNRPDPPTDPEWHLAAIRALDAWETSRGAGILIAQPDTGTADHHLLSGALKIRNSCNLLERNRPPYDPLHNWGNPGHGTATAGVAASRGNDADKRIRGVAPGATVLPVRCVQSVILLDGNGPTLAEAIRRAADEGAQVVSMSLGGITPILMAFVHAAIKHAAERGVVFVAAAGNGAPNARGLATYPGIDYYCACIAGSTSDDSGWNESLGGPSVTVSAPAAGVWCAWREAGDNPQVATRKVGAGWGTSYATAIVGGVAALWIAHHGHANLVGRLGGWRVTKEFQRLLRETARVPAGWDTGYYGAGIVDAKALLEAELREPELVDDSGGAPVDDRHPALRERLEAAGVDPALVARLDDALVVRYGGELEMHLALAEQRRLAPDFPMPPGAARFSTACREAFAQAGAAAALDAILSA